MSTGESTESKCPHENGFRMDASTAFGYCHCSDCGERFPMSTAFDWYEASIRTLQSQVKDLTQRLKGQVRGFY